ncbi:U-box domain-containing protein 15-like [Selaginella moellendorffii]|uniref:U-box domain-containing protein 15-like n=1 Tax=Selaginella moellendorffii TaxID=88036 RepID=UPI000D1CC315|nr:U-box domain-containing protein 15-like [Selaginella moellendorffii]|eukprot:XP_024518321.1 U-box domain-containing protein 15-like [Selaginella moellendorffii]
MRRMSRDSAENRVVLAELGVIPSLVDLLTISAVSACKQPLLALLNLAIGNSRNKQWIVEAGAVPILVRILSSATSAADVVESAIAALLSLSALDSNKPIIGHSGASQQLVRIVRTKSSSSIIKDSTRVLYNLSISSANVGRMVADGAADALLNLLNTDADSDPLVADRILATLGNLAELSEEARKCLTSSAAIAKLLTALASYTATMEETSSSSSSSASASSGSEEDSQVYSKHLGPAATVARCQERVLYVLMLLTHHSWPARQAMVSAGAVTPLLEVALLGTAIAQRRAARILDCLREERFQRNARPMSAPLALPLAASSRMVQAPKHAVCEERRAVNWMVKQSLERNMEKMVRRARLPSEDLDASSRMTISSKLNRSFGSSSSSKAMLV